MPKNRKIRRQPTPSRRTVKRRNNSSAERPPLTRVFIPNRGEIACRLISACHKLSLTPILGYSIADSASRATRLCHESVCIGASDAQDSYLNIDKVLAAACEARADAIHPGYGFLSENAEFSRNTTRLGLRFIGPSHTAMKLLGDKVEAKKLAQACKIPLLEDISFSEKDLVSQELKDRLKRYLKKVSFPLLVKAAGGGGGRGMRVVAHRDQLEEQMLAASREAKSLFNDATIFIEPYIIGARHVEVQIVADGSGDTRAVGTRDCSLQRRHQKVIEEAPASQLTPSLMKKLNLAAEKICQAANYESLATVEFLVTAKGQYYFLEVNTRLQVEHPATELATGLDLVCLQLQIAQGLLLSELLPRQYQQSTYAIEARICAEAPELDFRSSTGSILEARYPEIPGVRVDYGFEQGDRITHFYDSLIAKVVASGKTRAEAVKKLQRALQNTQLSPSRTNIGYLLALVSSKEFQQNRHTLLSAAEVLEEFNRGFQSRLTLALLAAALLKSLPESDTPWTALGNWSTCGASASHLHIGVNGTYYRVALSRDLGHWNVSIFHDQMCLLEKEQVEFVRTGPDTWIVTSNGRTTAGSYTQPTPDLITVMCQGDLFAAEFDSPRPRKAAQSVATSGLVEIHAHLPGKIVATIATAGKMAHESTPMIVLESMKMEHILNAPVTGTVEELLVVPGQTIAAGDLLAVLRVAQSS